MVTMQKGTDSAVIATIKLLKKLILDAILLFGISIGPLMTDRFCNIYPTYARLTEILSP